MSMSSRSDPDRRAWLRGKDWLLGLAEWNGCCRTADKSEQPEQDADEVDDDHLHLKGE